MENNKESKKSFWATLFAYKKKSCCSNSDIVVKEAIKPYKSNCCPSTSGASDVIVIGPGCAKCKETYKVVERVISENGLSISLSKIEDIVEMMKYNIMTTPAVVVDGVVKIKGHVPSAEEVKKALGL